jgi:diguanylate cyclase (GGDEF)-like protein
MPLPLERDQIQQYTQELEVIIAAHLAWLKKFNAALVCGGEPVGAYLDSDAFLKTPFGRWYYTADTHPMAEYPGFQELAGIQKSMHESARAILGVVRDGQRPTTEMHDNWLDLSLRLNTKLRHLQLEIIGDLLSTDPLTGCFTRRGMINRLQSEQERCLRIQRPCCLCLMDFDHFKRVNDECGHPAGDAVLRQGTKFTQNILRKYDSIFRYGGEEFLICLPSTPLDDAKQVIERIRAGLESLPIVAPDGRSMRVTASFGLVEMHPRKPVEDSIAVADEAMLLAKQNGRNRIELGEIV